MKSISVEAFYEDMTGHVPEEISREIGHFNVFCYEDVIADFKGKGIMPYSKRDYYKISLIHGNYSAVYADKEMKLQGDSLLFATPKVPYHYVPEDDRQSGYFCIFTEDFLTRNLSGIALDELPIFKPGGYPIFEISQE